MGIKASGPHTTANYISTWMESSTPSTNDAPAHDDSLASQVMTLADGRVLGFGEFGSQTGTPVFCMHGLPDSRFAGLEAHAAACSLNVRIICPDRPGIGLSSPRTKDQPGFKKPVVAFADDVAALAEHLGIERFAVLGVSGGGPYALACAYKLGRADGLTAVGLLAAMGHWSSGTAGMQLTMRIAMNLMAWMPQLGALLWRSTENAARNPDPEVLRKALAAAASTLPPEDAKVVKTKETQEIMIRSLREAYRQGGAAVIAEARLVSSANGWGFEVKDVTYPGIKLWYGTRDTNTPVKLGRDLAAQLNDAQMTEWAESHYTIAQNKTHAVLADILEAMEWE